MRDLTIRRFTLDPTHCNGHTFRSNIEGGGLIQLYLGGVCGRVVTKSHYGHQSQVRAQAWQMDDGVDWEALKTVSARIQYHIRSRLARCQRRWVSERRLSRCAEWMMRQRGSSATAIPWP